MENNDSLFVLIKSLTKGEKVHFRRLVNQTTYEKALGYIILFDVLDKQKIFDRDKAISILKEKGVTDNYPETRNYLYNKILDFLADFHSTDSIQRAVENDILKAQVLYDKELYTDSKKIIEQTKNLAITHELHLQLLKIIRLEQLLVNKLEHGDVEQLYLKYELEQKNEIKRLSNTVDYTNILNRLYTLHLRNHTIRNEEDIQKIENLIQSDLLQDISKAISYKAKLDFYYAYIYYYILKDDKIKLYDTYEKYLNLLQSDSVKANEKSINYYVILINYLMLGLAIKKMEHLKEGIIKLDGVSLSNQSHQTRVENLTYIIKAKVLLLQAKPDALFELLKKWNNEHERLIKTPFYKEIFLVNQLCSAYGYFLTENYKMTNVALTIILEEAKSEVRKDIILYARILKLISDFELKKFDLLDYSITTTKALLKRHQQLYDLENLILQHLKGLVYLVDRSALKEKFELFKNAINKEIDKSTIEIVTEQFDLLSWLDSKIENKSMLQILKERAEKEYPEVMKLFI